MNIKQLKQYIQDLPDDMEITRWDDDNLWFKKIEDISIQNQSFYDIGIKGSFLNFK